MRNLKGIILAGGTGSRLHPITKVTSKQLLPIYDKPTIYYPLSTLMLAEIREILVITTPNDLQRFQNLLGNGDEWGISLKYKAQSNPNGLAEALIIGEDFLDGSGCTLILGDNLFFGAGLPSLLKNSIKENAGATIFGHTVLKPEYYGVICKDENGNVKELIEKPKTPVSNLAATGLYIFDENAPARAKGLLPSTRGELEITDLNKTYLEENRLRCVDLSRGVTWFDVGEFDNLLDAGNFVKVTQKRHGMQISNPNEIAKGFGWID